MHLLMSGFYCPEVTCAVDRILKSIIGRSCHKYHFCCDKHVFVTTNICCDRSFVKTNIFCCDKHNFVMTKVWSRQAYFYLDKRHVLTKEKFCRDKNILSR